MRKLCPREVVSFDILLLRTFPPSGVFPSALTEEFDRRFTAAACSWHLRADGSAHIEASVLGLKQGFSLKRSGNDLSRGRLGDIRPCHSVQSFEHGTDSQLIC
eukprot:m.355573 g.355573  ORF g.355573 m.355573 type:complete len:103 (-) comp55943_c0_seq17:465-773(-)